jgi:hypothetical protein
MPEMDTVAEYLVGVDTELACVDFQAKTLRDDHMLQVNIKMLMRNWKGVEKDFKQYINAVRAVHAFAALNRATTSSKDHGDGCGATPPKNEGHESQTTSRVNTDYIVL